MNGKALLIVIDGSGVDRARCRQIAEATWDYLAAPDKLAISEAAMQVARSTPGCPVDPATLAKLSLFPTWAEALGEGVPTPRAQALIAAIGGVAGRPETQAPLHRARLCLRQVARDMRYVPWAVDAQHSASLRNANVTVPTSAAGEWAGFEPLDPPVQGNSETGHQQIGNLSMAPQLPLEISNAIDSGEFFENRALRAAIEHGAKPGSALNVAFMLSGTGGSDGRVHSAWNHLEAFLELVFTRVGLRPSQLRIQAILDGRDSPPTASLDRQNGLGGYIDSLEALLGRYGATESLAWVVGRSTGMDRDYREVNARADYLLLTTGNGLQVDGFDGVRRAIAEVHSRGLTDQDVPPIVVKGPDQSVGMVGPGQAFVNLNFRSDRQRSKIASLVGAREFLRAEGDRRGRDWKLDWLRPLPGLHVCGMAEYHPEFATRYGVSVAFPTLPHRENLLGLWEQVMPGEKYLLVAESIKAPHMGYFLRGRREEAVVGGIEDRIIVPSAGEAEGIRSDTDFYMMPQMRNPEVAATVIENLSSDRYRLICCNLSATDMIGHLLPERFEEAISAFESTDLAVWAMTDAATRAGWSTIITADHGNIEEDGPAHSANDVLTTIIPPAGKFEYSPRPNFQARLFDVAWTVVRLLGSDSETKAAFEGLDDARYRKENIGSSLVR